MIFDKTGEGAVRLRAALDAIDLCAIEDRDGWARYTVWCDRRTGVGLDEGVKPESRLRVWVRNLRRMRANGIDYECNASPDGAGSSAERAVRFTPEGRATLRRLVAELDAWLLSTEVA